MKRTLSLIIAMILCIQLVSVSAFAAGAQDATTAEIELELASAEEILGGPCKLEAQETKVVGNYIVENRFYVLDTPATRASSGKVGGVSSQVWRDVFESTWNIKVLLSAFFYYNGTTAICIPEESDVWAVNSSGQEVDLNSAILSHKDGTTAKTSCRYTIDFGGIPEIADTLNVTCTKTGDVGIVSEEEHRY